MKNLPKTPPKPGDVGLEEEPSPAMQLMASFQDNLSYTVFSVLSTLVAVLITVMLLVNWRKREQEIATQTTDKEKKETNEADDAESERPDSEGQEASEEELPWLLRKAPSEISLSDAKSGWVNDEKRSDGSGSEKSQESVRILQKGCGDSQVANSIKIITADDDYVFVED